MVIVTQATHLETVETVETVETAGANNPLSRLIMRRVRLKEQEGRSLIYRFDLSFPVLSWSCLYFLSKETKTRFGFVAERR